MDVTAGLENTGTVAVAGSAGEPSSISQAKGELGAESMENVLLLEQALKSLKKHSISGDMDELDRGISLTKARFTKIPVNSPTYITALNNLASALTNRFAQRGDVQDIDEAISTLRQALELAPSPYTDQSLQSLTNLATAVSIRFEYRGDAQDLDESVTLHKQCLELRPPSDPFRSLALNNLANGLFTRFQQRGDARDLDESLTLYRQALQLLPPPDPRRSDTLNNLAIALETRFSERGVAEDLDESITLHKEALELTPRPHPDRPMVLNNLGSALSTRFDQRGDAQDLEGLIALNTEALELLPSTHPDRFLSLNNLAIGLKTRFRERGDVQDIDKSVALHRQAINLLPPSHPSRSSSLDVLATALSTRFEQGGDPGDFDECISFYRQALELRPSAHPLRPMSLNNLAVALKTRFQERADFQDLEESQALCRQALELLPPPHPLRVMSLNNLANGLYIKFQEQNDARALEESIAHFRQALELLPPSHPSRAASLNNLGTALSTRFEKLGDAQDLDQAITSHRQSLEARHPSHPDRYTSLVNLANALTARYVKQGNPQDLTDALSLHTQGFESLPVNHPLRPESLAHLALTYIHAISSQSTTDPAHLEEAMRLLSEAAHSDSQSSSARFRKAATWAYYAGRYHHPSRLEALEASVGLLPELAALGLDIQSRQNSLTSGTDGLAREAASCAINEGDLEKAIGFLETGRSVFWSQFLSLRSPFDELHDVAPELAKDLRRVSNELEKGSHRDKANVELSNSQKLSLEGEARRFEQLAQEWTKTVAKVRELKGFEDFLRPQKMSALQTATKRGPIVYFIANTDSSDCLIVTTTSVHHIPLPNLPIPVLSELVKLVQIAASESQIPVARLESLVEGWTDLHQPIIGTMRSWADEGKDRGMRPERNVAGLKSSDDIFNHVLEILWDEAVKHVVNFLGLEKSSKPSRVMWCPTGLFTFLPIHAAGRYHEGLVDCVADYMISSYTPTIAALLTPDPPPVEPFKLMAVIDSRYLPSTREELANIEEHVAGEYLLRFGTRETPASVEAVASQLSAASIVHFACHGKQVSANPLESGLEIGGEKLTISRIMKESVPKGSLAFLSACETAMGDEKTPDEAMNIGASLLFTGFKSVVATMWRMWDKDGPVVAAAFYSELFKGPDGRSMLLPDTSRSAEALAVAVGELRSRGVPFKRWVPFIHMGN